MLTPPAISTATWWVITAVTTAMYLAVLIPVMPTHQYKVRAACGPLLGLIYLPAAAHLRQHSLETVLAMHSTVMIAFCAGFAGRKKEMRKIAEEERLFGKKGNHPTLAAQVVTAFVVALVLFMWVTGKFETYP
ncbi:hypothetical protein ADL22_01080 [Streptomyces sp. NRRL F-4489]|nr:hypothetical protein ADL22_01080 [Streptomyces sp. NRRL F-4489]